ncbi:MAG: helix-hairpin-helix domain-containing protein [Mariniblastus sp.]|nr:helix-hairpin-helix domain-containing protein [Mariniblastus sp.]
MPLKKLPGKGLSESSPVGRYPLVLRRSDQPMVAALMLVALLGMGGYFWLQSTRQAGLVDIDRAPSRTVHFKVDINTAEWPELANLPGIGPTYARSIVEYRQQHGPFRSHEALMAIAGIGPGKLKQICPYLAPIPEPISPRPDSE